MSEEHDDPRSIATALGVGSVAGAIGQRLPVSVLDALKPITNIPNTRPIEDFIEGASKYGLSDVGIFPYMPGMPSSEPFFSVGEFGPQISVGKRPILGAAAGKPYELGGLKTVQKWDGRDGALGVMRFGLHQPVGGWFSDGFQWCGWAFGVVRERLDLRGGDMAAWRRVPVLSIAGVDAVAGPLFQPAWVLAFWPCAPAHRRRSDPDGGWWRRPGVGRDRGPCFPDAGRSGCLGLLGCSTVFLLFAHAVAGSLNDYCVAVMQESVEQCTGEDAVVVERFGPVFVDAVGGQCDRAAFVTFRDDLEEQVRSGLVQGYEPELVNAEQLG